MKKRPNELEDRIEKLEEAVLSLLRIYKYLSIFLESLTKQLNRIPEIPGTDGGVT